MAEKSLEEKIQRALDYQEIQNVMAKHVYYHNVRRHMEELETIWAQKTPGVSWTNNEGSKVGIEELTESYGRGGDLWGKMSLEKVRERHPEIENIPENYGIGSFVVHPLTTPCIEVAGDGKTAKGVWYSPGEVTELDADGNPFASWVWEKYGVDFVKEDGKWKIWHIHMYYDFNIPVGGSWTEGPPKDWPPPMLGGPQKPEIPAKVIYEQYHPTRVPQFEPRPPEPYETFSETFSYGP